MSGTCPTCHLVARPDHRTFLPPSLLGLIYSKVLLLWQLFSYRHIARSFETVSKIWLRKEVTTCTTITGAIPIDYMWSGSHDINHLHATAALFLKVKLQAISLIRCLIKLLQPVGKCFFCYPNGILVHLTRRR